MSSVVLIPGVKVSVDGVSNDQGVAAKTITVDGDDLETAEMIQSGLHPTAEQVAANVQTLAEHQDKIETNKVQLAAHKEYIETNQKNIASNKQQIDANVKDIEENTQRFMALSEYDVKGQTTVKFKVGSAKIAPEDEEQLKQLAQTAEGLKGYIVEVMGYADSTGNAAMNTKLSEDRAKAVITYLVQQGAVPIRHIVAPARWVNTEKQHRMRPRRAGPKTVGLKSKSWSIRASPVAKQHSLSCRRIGPSHGNRNVSCQDNPRG